MGIFGGDSANISYDMSRNFFGPLDVKIIVHCLFVIVKQLQNCLLLIDALSHLIQIFVIMQVLFLLCNRMH